MWLQPQVIDDIGIPLPPILWNAPHKPQVRRVLEPRMARSQVTCFPNMDPSLGPSKASPIPAPGCTLECPLPSHPCSRTHCATNGIVVFNRPKPSPSPHLLTHHLCVSKVWVPAGPGGNLDAESLCFWIRAPHAVAVGSRACRTQWRFAWRAIASGFFNSGCTRAVLLRLCTEMALCPALLTSAVVSVTSTTLSPSSTRIADDLFWLMEDLARYLLVIW